MSDTVVTRDEYVGLMKDVAQNAANISIIMNHVEDQRSDTKTILSYIETDRATGRKGLYARQEDHEQRLDAIEMERSNDKTKQKIWISIATFAGGLIMTIGTYIFKLLFPGK